jgi:2'-5' RNA ligase
MGVRAFIALDIDAGARGRLSSALEELRPRLAGVKWVRPEGIHLTLRFLGDSEPDVLERLRPALAEAAARCPATSAPLTGFGLFPARGAPRVLWVGLQPEDSVRLLQAECEAAAVRCGFAPEPRPFAAHLTLGRWRERAPRPELPGAELGLTRLDTLLLMRSELRRGGAVYTPVASFPLSG